MMFNRSKAQAIALLVAVFLAGGAAGWGVAASRGDPRPPRRGPDAMVDFLAGKLHLSAPQRDSAQAVRRALQVQPAMVQAEGDQRNAGAGYRAALGAFLPSLTITSSAARSNVSVIDRTTGIQVPPQYSYTSSLSASLDLFTGFRR